LHGHGEHCEETRICDGVACGTNEVQMRRYLVESLSESQVSMYLIELSAGSLGAVAADVLPAAHLPDVHATVLPRQTNHRDTS
jgi:hypothetical protein